MLARIFRDMAAVDEDEGADQWLVLDGCLGGQWSCVLERALLQDGTLFGKQLHYM